MTSIPNCEWQWEGRCRRSPPEWLSIKNECLVEKSSSRMPCGHYHYGTEERGAESKDEEAPERRGFRAGVDLCLGVIDTTNVNRIERGKKETIRKAPKQFKYHKNIWKGVRMHGKCMNMWHAKKLHHGLNPIQSYQHIVNRTHLKCMIILLLC